MFTQDYFEKHFKLHNKLVLYTSDNIKIEIAKEPHFHLEGGHTNLDLMDAEDLTAFCNARGLQTQPSKDTTV